MVKNDKVILTDCDGACLDWEFGFHTWMQAHGHELKDKNVYKVSKQYDIDNNVANQLVRTFNESASIGFLPPLRDAQYYIKLMSEELGYRFVAVSSLSADPSAQKLRTCNLNKLFGKDNFIEFHYLDCGADKDEILNKLANKYKGSIWVEDKYVNADLGQSLGYDSLLVEHGHNLGYLGTCKVVKDWKEIYEHAKEKSSGT